MLKAILNDVEPIFRDLRARIPSLKRTIPAGAPNSFIKAVWRGVPPGEVTRGGEAGGLGVASSA